MSLNSNSWGIELYFHGTIQYNGMVVANYDSDTKNKIIPELEMELHFEQNSLPVKLSFNIIADNQKVAVTKALYVIGLLRDVICWRTDLPIEISFSPEMEKKSDGHAVCHLTNGSIESYLKVISACRTNPQLFPLLNAMSWYRKGICSSDPFDKFTALWMVLEIVSKKYYIDTDETNARYPYDKVNICFKHYQEKEYNNMVTDTKNWTKDMYEIRCNIIHGEKPLDVLSLEKVATELLELQKRAHMLLDIFGEQYLKDCLSKEGKSVIPPIFQFRGGFLNE